jgi:phage anti-repressor protein
MKEKLNIIKAVINGEEQSAVNARELWQALQSKQEFCKWIKDRLADFVEGVDYCFDKIVKTGKNVTGKQLYHEYTLTLDTAKHLCMLERNEQGKKIRQYFIEFEKGARKAIEDMVKDYEGNIKFCRDMYAQKCMEKNPCHVVSRRVDITTSTAALIEKINLRLIAGEEVEREVLRYAWNIGRLVGKTLAPQKHVSGIENFIMGIAAGEYPRHEIYEAYCANCANPVSARRFWPIVRGIRPCSEIRRPYCRLVVF